MNVMGFLWESGCPSSPREHPLKPSCTEGVGWREHQRSSCYSQHRGCRRLAGSGFHPAWPPQLLGRPVSLSFLQPHSSSLLLRMSRIENTLETKWLFFLTLNFSLARVHPGLRSLGMAPPQVTAIQAGTGLCLIYHRLFLRLLAQLSFALTSWYISVALLSGLVGLLPGGLARQPRKVTASAVWTGGGQRG